MPEADLYRSKINLCRYCAAESIEACQEFLGRLRAGAIRADEDRLLTIRQMDAFKLVLDAGTYLPSLPLLTTPQPIEAGLVAVNEPGEDSLVLVSGNSRLTFEVLTAIWAQGTTPAYFLLVDCSGNTVDMAMIYGEFTAERLTKALLASGLQKKVTHRRMVVPGLTAPLARDFAAATNWEIEIGPVCAVELPLFLGDRWIPPDR